MRDKYDDDRDKLLERLVCAVEHIAIAMHTGLSSYEREIVQARVAQMNVSRTRLQAAIDSVTVAPSGVITKITPIQQSNPRKEDTHMDPDIQAMIDEATADESVESAAATLLAALFAKLQAAVNAAGSLNDADRAVLQSKVAELKAQSANLAAAIAANTPADASGSSGDTSTPPATPASAQ